jgi:hypothetical protein
MLFQTFDDKENCSLVYKKRKFHKQVTEDCTRTWSYAPHLSDNNIEYANLYANGQSLDAICPPEIKGEWTQNQKRIKAVIKSCRHAGLDLKKHCIYDVVPRHHLTKFAETKNKICNYVFDNFQRPSNYDHLLKINKMTAEIKNQKLQLEPSKIERLTLQDRNVYKKIMSTEPYIDYDMFKTITGRLAAKPNSFPVMTIAKKYRAVIFPKNDWLFELDFNACELRTAMALLGYEQPEEDLHEWNLKNVFTRAKDRNNAKKRIFSWLYNPNNRDDKISKIYDREKLKELYYDGEKILNPFGREIYCDENHVVSYLVQSTAADLVFEQMYKIWEFLRSRKSFIKFCNHDSVMIDLHTEQEYEFNEIKELFSNTRFGTFKVNCSGGENWAEMKDLYIK